MPVPLLPVPLLPVLRLPEVRLCGPLRAVCWWPDGAAAA